ncbi:MAG: hypothetical protein AAF551_00170 [Bacteroidota bacterium]
MALDFVIMDGDTVIFKPNCGAATVVVRPGKIKASGLSTINGKKFCVEGDEKSVTVAGCLYTKLSHLKPGSGTLKIKKLADDQLTTRIFSGKDRIILKGSSFESVFEVNTPAEDIKPVAAGGAPPDQSGPYRGEGQIIPGTSKIKAL